MNIEGYNIITLIYIYNLALSLITFILMGIDKLKAKRNKLRIKESILLFFALLGGNIGLILGIVVFKHKIRNKKFYLGGCAIYILHSIIFMILLLKTCN